MKQIWKSHEIKVIPYLLERMLTTVLCYVMLRFQCLGEKRLAWLVMANFKFQKYFYEFQLQ